MSEREVYELRPHIARAPRSAASAQRPSAHPTQIDNRRDTHHHDHHAELTHTLARVHLSLPPHSTD